MTAFVGIDPGVKHTGVVVLDGSAGYVRGATTSTGGPVVVVSLLRQWLEEGLKELEAEDVVFGIEEQRYVQRGRTAEGKSNFAASAVRDVQWALYGVVERLGPVFLIDPRTAKKTMVGNGRATKKQMIAIACRRFGGVIDSEHLADAAAVAMATRTVWRTQALKSAKGQ